MEKNKFFHTLESIYLCIKFPFLYPRNRFTDKHWNNWKIEHYLYGKPAEWKTIKGEDGIYHPKKVKEATKGLYDKAYQTTTSFIEDTEYIHDEIKSIPWFIWYNIISFLYNYIFSIFHCIPTYTELDAMDKGWKKAFGIQMCQEIKDSILKEKGRKFLHQYRILQIKEKYGSLRWYDNMTTNEIQNIIDKYEDLSLRTCIVCGKPAKYMTPYESWRCPYCEEHVPDYIAKEFLEEIK